MSRRIRMITILIGMIELVKGLAGSYLFFLIMAYLYYGITFFSGPVGRESLNLILCVLFPFPVLLASSAGLFTRSNLARHCVLMVNSLMLFVGVVYGGLLIKAMRQGLPFTAGFIVICAFAALALPSIVVLNLPSVRREYVRG